MGLCLSNMCDAVCCPLLLPVSCHTEKADVCSFRCMPYNLTDSLEQYVLGS